MSFVHEQPEFSALITAVERETRVEAALVEKDYWTTHSLWALHETGFAIWFKGDTSLSKGFGIIERFSEDLDLMIEGGGVTTLPEVTNWASTNKGRSGGHASRSMRLARQSASGLTRCASDVRSVWSRSRSRPSGRFSPTRRTTTRGS